MTVMDPEIQPKGLLPADDYTRRDRAVPLL